MMRKAVNHAWQTYQHAKCGMLARALPKLLRDAQAADTAYTGTEECRTAAHLLAQVYQLASSTLRKLGEHELSWLAADRSIAVSQRAGDQLLAGTATTFRVEHLREPAQARVLRDGSVYEGWRVSGETSIEIKAEVQDHSYLVMKEEMEKTCR